MSRKNSNFNYFYASPQKPSLSKIRRNGNRSMFLKTDGRGHGSIVARTCFHLFTQWFIIESRFFTEEKFDLLILSLDKPIPKVQNQKFSDRIEKLFQLDMDQKDSMYSLTANIVHQDKLAIFRPQDINPIASHSSTEA